MAFDFPSSPALNEEFDVGAITYVWNGYGWSIKVGGDAPETGQDFWRNNAGWVVGSWGSLDDKPDTFPPGPHLHPISDVTGLQTQLDTINATNTGQDATIALKADKTYVDAQNATQDTTINGKANTTYVDTQNAAQDTTIALKADKTYVDGANTTQDTAIAGKEPAIALGTTGDYWRGDKSWQPLISGVTVADNVPAGALPNSLWWESDSGGLFLRYSDGSSVQWVQVNEAGVGDAPGDGAWYGRINNSWAKVLPIVGGSLTGFLTLHADPTGLSHAVTKSYADSKLPLAGGTLSGALNGTTGTFSGELKCASTLRLSADNSKYLHFDGTNYSLGGSGTVWTSGNFAPGAYAPIGGVSGNWIVGSSTHGTDGNIYMPWAGYWLSTYFSLFAPLSGANFGGTVTVAGGLFNAGAPTTAGVANTHMSNPDGNRLYRNNSSLAYKTAVEPLAPEYGDKILALKPIFYRSNEATADDPTWSWFGFSAENCNEVDFRFCSYTVAEENKGEGWTKAPLIPENIHTHGILAALVELVQRQEQRIQALEARYGV